MGMSVRNCGHSRQRHVNISGFFFRVRHTLGGVVTKIPRFLYLLECPFYEVPSGGVSGPWPVAVMQLLHVMLVGGYKP